MKNEIKIILISVITILLNFFIVLPIALIYHCLFSVPREASINGFLHENFGKNASKRTQKVFKPIIF